VNVPSLDDLLGAEPLPAAQRQRIEGVHAMLREAGPPPELPPSLAPDPSVGAQRLMPRRRRVALLALAAALAIALFGLGYLFGERDSGAEPTRLLSLRGTAVAPDAQASMAVYAADAAGNREIELTVRGLPELPEGSEYELWLTKDGEPVARSGSFVVEEGETTVVHLTTPWRPALREQWSVMREGSTEPLLVAARQGA
jgi:hypothetical protein